MNEWFQWGRLIWNLSTYRGAYFQNGFSGPLFHSSIWIEHPEKKLYSNYIPVPSDLLLPMELYNIKIWTKILVARLTKLIFFTVTRWSCTHVKVEPALRKVFELLRTKNVNNLYKSIEFLFWIVEKLLIECHYFMRYLFIYAKKCWK